jgi:segregation and condensation protein B
MSSEKKHIKSILEAVLFGAHEPLSLKKLHSFFPKEEVVDISVIREQLEVLRQDYHGRAIELKEVASGYRFQVCQEWAAPLNQLWDEKPPRYSRALLETLVLIAYRQPITRAEIEEIRGVAVSSHIIKTLLERHWVRIVGHKEVPGRPSLYATTNDFLSYFNLKNLQELPELQQIRDLDLIEEKMGKQLELDLDTSMTEIEEDMVTIHLIAENLL